ncbi:MAG: NADP-dependent oxidoreductase, partial [Gramella sp.]|nr:NADP-dependent oxidoreductase [Christiangramia sp.]
MKETKTILLNSRPKGKPESSDFKFETEQVTELESGQVLLSAKYVSVDPYLRGRMSDAKSYIAPFEIGKPIASAIIAEVVESKADKLKKGDHVSGLLDWKEFQVASADKLMKVDKEKAPLSAYLGILGMTGLTAYLGLTEIG